MTKKVFQEKIKLTDSLKVRHPQVWDQPRRGRLFFTHICVPLLDMKPDYKYDNNLANDRQ